MKYSMSITKGKGNIKHNNRTQVATPKHINKAKTIDNIVLVNEDIKEVYKREFNEAIKEYNDLQKREDRKIKDYYSKILHSKKDKTFHELIIQIGNKDKKPLINETNGIYISFLDEFKKHNPSLKVFNAVIHNDETTAHMHIDYVPVATRNINGKGLRLKVSNNKAIKDDGYKDWKHWREEQERILEEVCKDYKIEREYMNNTNYHIADVAKYKELQKDIDKEFKNIKNTISKDNKVKQPFSESSFKLKVNFLGKYKKEDVEKAINKAIARDESRYNDIVSLRKNNVKKDAIIAKQAKEIEVLKKDIHIAKITSIKHEKYLLIKEYESKIDTLEEDIYYYKNKCDRLNKSFNNYKDMFNQLLDFAKEKLKNYIFNIKGFNWFSDEQNLSLEIKNKEISREQKLEKQYKLKKNNYYLDR